jgi:MFS family permease
VEPTDPPTEERDEPEPQGLIARARAHLMDLTPLRTSRDFRLLFLGKSISDLGDEIVVVAVAYQVFQLTHSTLAVGLLGLCALVPVLFLPILGGAVADTVERRRLTIVAHGVLAAMSALMAFNASLAHPKLWPLYVFTVLSAGLYTFNRPAISTWPARLLPVELLPSSNALEAGFRTIASMGGPLLAGVLLATIGPTGTFVVDVVTFLVVIACVWAMAPSPPAEDAPELTWEAVKDGLRFLRGKRNVQSVFLADLNAMIFGFPMALFPAISVSLWPQNPAFALGLLYAAPSLGAFVATAFSGRAKHVRRQGRAVMWAIALWGSAIVVFGFSKTLWLSCAMLVVAGLGDMVSGIYRATILQSAVTDSMRGRLDGIGMAVWATGPSLGELESGVVAHVTSVAFSAVSGGILCVAGIAVIRLLMPGFAAYDAKHPVP